MKVAIIFYSFSGNTRAACSSLKDKLSKETETIFIELRPKKESQAFLGQCREAFLKKEPVLDDVGLDLSSYDFCIFSSPVWAFTYAPALRSYLKKVKGLNDKKCCCFLTFGSGAGSGKALRELEAVLKEKGGRILFSKNLSGLKSRDKEFLESFLKPLIEIITGKEQI